MIKSNYNRKEGVTIKTFLRDCKILKPEIKQIVKKAAIINVLVIIIYVVIDTVMVGSGATPILDGKILLAIMLTTVNLGIVFGFFSVYFSEWRLTIHEAFKEYDMNKKYQFFSDRFNNLEEK